MKECIICRKKAIPIVSRYLTDGSVICPNCLEELPQCLISKAVLTPYDIDCAIDYREHSRAMSLTEIFEETAHFGRMSIDEHHGIFVIGDRTNVDKLGKLKNKMVSDIYYLLMFRSVSFPIRIKNPDGSCTIYFAGQLEKYIMNIEIPISYRSKAVLIPNDDESAYVQGPEDFEIFKGLFIELYNKHVELYNYEKHLKEEQNSKAKDAGLKEQKLDVDNIDFIKAKALFMLNDVYTLEELKHQRAVLLKCFHPDSCNVSDGKYVDKINTAYQLLKSSLERNQHEKE